MRFTINLTKPSYNNDDIQVMKNSINSFITSQSKIKTSFEKKFTGFLDNAGSIGTNSGTSALILALRTLEISSGDEVIIPSYTCLAVLNAVVQVGATPVFADIVCNPLQMDYNINADTVRKVITKGTKAIILPHMFGVPAKIDELLEIGIPIIEDITLSLGAHYKGKLVGGWGPISICSFHSSKMISSGEGGILSTISQDLIRKARLLNGWEDEQISWRFEKKKSQKYNLRYNFRMNDISAALAISQLTRLSKFIEIRRSLAQYYNERLRKINNIIMPTINEAPNVFYRYLIFLKHMKALEVVKLFAKAGIEAGRGVYPPLHYLYGKGSGNFTETEKAVNSVISIPLYPALQTEEVDYILKCSNEILT